MCIHKIICNNLTLNNSKAVVPFSMRTTCFTEKRANISKGLYQEHLK